MPLMPSVTDGRFSVHLKPSVTDGRFSVHLKPSVTDGRRVSRHCYDTKYPYLGLE